MKLISHNSHRLYIAGASVIILVIGIFLGAILAENLGVNVGLVDFEAVKIGLALATITILLIMGSFILQIKETLESKKGKKQ
jgi:hypothetical protein